jgi:hypothetical protein
MIEFNTGGDLGVIVSYLAKSNAPFPTMKQLHANEGFSKRKIRLSLKRIQQDSKR